MYIRTKFFGDLEVLESQVIHFEEGLPGFDNLKDFIILNNTDTKDPVPFMWFQSVKEDDVTFVVTFPYFFDPQYELLIDDEIVSKLDIQSENEIGIYSIVKIEDRVEDMTVNLASPIIINSRNFKGLQYIRPDNQYGVQEKFKKNS